MAREIKEAKASFGEGLTNESKYSGSITHETSIVYERNLLDERPQRYEQQEDEVDDNSLSLLHEEMILCDPCKSSNENENTKIPLATQRCIDCEENYCKNCSRIHNKLRSFRQHKCVEIDKLRTKLMKVTDVQGAVSLKNNIFCDLCSKMDETDLTEILNATQYCVDCNENHCDECSRAHKKQRQFREHAIVAIAEQMRRLMEAKNDSKVIQPIIRCDLCKDMNETCEEELPLAIVLCTDCQENLCEECSRAHKKQRKFRDHSFAKIDEPLMKKLTRHNSVKQTETQENKYDNCKQELKRQDRFKGYGQDGPVGLSVFLPGASSLNRKMNTPMKNFIENEMPELLKDENYFKIRLIIQQPNKIPVDFENFWRIVMPYIIQRIQLWNGDVINPQNLTSLLIETPFLPMHASGNQFARKSAAEMKGVVMGKTPISPVSRLDCLTYILNAADCLVAQDILLILSKFPMAIPLIIRDIREDGKYIVTTPALQNIVIRWETTPEHIVENYLFTSPFKMVAAVRLGINKIGKSMILNQLMRKQFTFSSCGEPGSKYGRPVTLDGAVEIVWLTQETCSDTTWKKTMCDYYKGNAEQVVLLANFHGDVLMHPDSLNYLAKLACSFIVFVMPGASENHLKKLNNFISNEHIVHVIVDPEEMSSSITIRTAYLSSDDVHEVVRFLLNESLKAHSNENISTENLGVRLPLRNIEFHRCDKIETIMEIIRSSHCSVKQQLKDIDSSQYMTWTQTIKGLIKISMDLFNLSPNEAKKSLLSLDKQLTLLSVKNSMAARLEVSAASENFRRLIKAPKNFTSERLLQKKKDGEKLQGVQEEFNLAIKEPDETNLGREHFIRALTSLYEQNLNSCNIKELKSILDLPDRFAELLLRGHVIELLIGDFGEIPLIWIRAICDDVAKKKPNLKVFVISIIGLQSSGKTTLLNALFSCRFAVSVGHCSRGLFMRMIFLEESLRKSHGFDAVILIDTEGLVSPEKMNDPKASHKDRLMATFAMGVSNLTIVNILGEGMTDMTEILQMAIVAMARLREGWIKPDILMVQHLQERNTVKLDQAKDQFCKAINKAFELISVRDIEIGSASAECLDELIARVQSGDLFKYFGPFKEGSTVNSPPSETYHEDVVNLYEIILNRTKDSKNKIAFDRWTDQLESYWKCVKEENFALNFKNVKHITDFLYFEKKTAKVKELLDRSFRFHSHNLSNEIKETVSSLIGSSSLNMGNKEIKVDVARSKVLDEIKEKMEKIPYSCLPDCDKCNEFLSEREVIFNEAMETEWREDIKRSVASYGDRLLEITKTMLQQTFDGSAVKQGCFAEFSGLIEKELQKALNLRPDANFTTSEQNHIVENIWELLENIASSKGTATCLDVKLNQALQTEYVITNVLPNIMRDFGTKITIEQLIQENTGKSTSESLFDFGYGENVKQEEHSLIDALKELVTSVFQCRSENYSTTGLDFEEGMVREIKHEFPLAIKRFENRFNIKLQDSFKLELQIYTLQQFRDRMVFLQAKWNGQNNPVEILKQKKQDYITEIETRLKCGFSYAGEGQIVAMKLSKAIKNKAIQAGYDVKVMLIKDLTWTTNSEKVRLQYYENLAKEIESGNKERALEYFERSQDSILDWYKTQIDSAYLEKNLWTRIVGRYSSTLRFEFDWVLQEIKDARTKDDINKFVKNYFKNADDQYYSKLNPKDDDIKAFIDSIVRNLQIFSEEEKRKIVENGDFRPASDDPEIMGRLGCTYRCFWCGALCWGSRGHHLDKGKNLELETHHSCHQPSGLQGTFCIRTKILQGRACHTYQDDCLVYFGKYKEVGIPWSKAKKNHFNDWRFDIHCNTTFDELMRWFFQELNEDIAKKWKLLPAPDHEMKKNKCKGLVLNNILQIVKSKI